MLIYILLIMSILAVSLFARVFVKSRERQENIILFIGIVMIFLLLALKKDTVGIDIEGYHIQYLLTRNVPWDSWDYVYFEKGYILLQKIFTILRFPFQAFVATLYAFFCVSIYVFIKKYSKNVTLSLLIFICYQFFVFSISGLRQTVAMGVCIWVFILCYEKNKTILSIILVVIAMQIHSSAVVFLCIPLIVKLSERKLSIPVWASLVVACVLGRSFLWEIIGYFYGVRISNAIWGGNLVFLFGITVFVAFTHYFSKSNEGALDKMFVRITMLSLMAYFVLCGSTLLRASMYFTLFFIVSIPYFIEKYRPRDRFLLNVAMGVFLIVLFYNDTLAINQLELCPYRFFWQ